MRLASGRGLIQLRQASEVLERLEAGLLQVVGVEGVVVGGSRCALVPVEMSLPLGVDCYVIVILGIFFVSYCSFA